MTDAPERIWAKLDRGSVDGSGAARLLAMDRPFGEYHGNPATPYIRADLFDVLKAENDRLRDEHNEMLGLLVKARAYVAERDELRAKVQQLRALIEDATRPGEAVGPQG